jgi:hypothetical protein
MSVHRPFTRGGRKLVLIRPAPFVPPPVPAQLWQMVRRPSAGVALVLRSQPDLGRLAAWLCGAGLVPLLAASFFGRAGAANSYFPLRTIAAFPGAWIAAALVLRTTAPLLGSSGGANRLRSTLQVTGVATCAGPLLAAVLPGPVIAGLLFGGWMAVICYQTARQLYGLGGWRAAAAALPGPIALAALWLTLHV